MSDSVDADTRLRDYLTSLGYPGGGDLNTLLVYYLHLFGGDATAAMMAAIAASKN